LEFHGRPGLLHPEWGAAEAACDTANVAGIAVRLGDPLFSLTIVGIWKMLGAIVIVIPRTPRLKEWADPGIFFNVTGAAASHAASADYGPSCFIL
jgi:hypothetical protein